MKNQVLSDVESPRLLPFPDERFHFAAYHCAVSHTISPYPVPEHRTKRKGGKKEIAMSWKVKVGYILMRTGFALLAALSMLALFAACGFTSWEVVSSVVGTGVRASSWPAIVF